MHEFTREQADQWNTWPQADAVSARRNDRLSRLYGVLLLAALTAFYVAMWR